MIRPAKHLDLNTCLLRAASKLLARLQEDRICSFEELKQALLPLGVDAECVFMPTMHFLYLVGRVDYHPHTDSFEYLAPAQEVAK